MDREKVIELAREAELARQFALEVPFVVDRLERFAALIEREVRGDAEPVANEVQLNIIRYWPDGFADRLEHVWKDLIGLIPNYKLYDLKRVLAEFGFTMQIYEGAAPTKTHPAPAVVRQLVEALEEVVNAADGKGWDQLDPLLKIQRAALEAVRRT